ncbi:Hypothetical_protein [Hexamita inflata]|uniref:Hypothetical_protein n=1 Tax=Hexamita inflata TaxID=28002 RepID=A0AA86R3Y4_9EUKA|nr:Hypothetical protein HINF_LOCUS53362 [Hexamita inflata]
MTLSYCSLGKIRADKKDVNVRLRMIPTLRANKILSFHQWSVTIKLKRQKHNLRCYSQLFALTNNHKKNQMEDDLMKKTKIELCTPNCYQLLSIELEDKI